MNEKRMCPGCQSAMQLFRVGEVEIDRCFFCGGFWFDAREMDRVAGRGLPVLLEGERAARTCPACAEPLARARIEDVAVESCTRCGGTYLDDGELEALAQRRVELGRPVSEAPVDGVSMACVICNEEIDLAMGVSGAGGFSCMPCAPMAEQRFGNFSPIAVGRQLNPAPLQVGGLLRMFGFLFGR